MSGLVQRLVTAIFFVAIMVGGLYGGPYTFGLLFAIISILCLWEFLSITLKDSDGNGALGRKAFGLVLGILPFTIVSIEMLDLAITNSDFLIKCTFLFFPLFFLAFLYELFTASKNPFTNLAYLSLGVFYIGIPFSLLYFIVFNGDNFQVNTVFGLLLLTWANDTGAYLVGSQIGKTPLFPRISPKKTWEGSMGGVIVTIGIAYVLSIWFTELYTTNWLVLGGIVAVFGSLGDLVESMLKRSKNIKDSGTILPGHGGLLDRFDAFIFLIPFAAAYLILIR